MDEAELIAIAKKLVAIKSTNDNPDGLQMAVDLVANIVTAHPGITVESFVHNGKPSFLAYAGPNKPKHFKVLLNAHVDVVPGDDALFQLRKDGDVLSGRGTLDMKLAAIVMADTFAKIAPGLSFDVGLQVVADEEVGGYDGTNYQKHLGVSADFVIAGEYTNLDICTESKGFCRLKLTMHGKTAHSANLWNGENAVVRLIRDLDQLLTIYPIPSQESWTTTVNIANLHTANPAVNLVPNIATADLDVRFIKDDKNFASKNAINMFFATIDPAVKVDFMTDVEPPIEIDAQDPFVDALAQATSDVTGHRPAIIRKHGSADARFYAPHAVVFGPTGKGIHANDEHVTLSSLHEYAKIIEKFLLVL